MSMCRLFKKEDNSHQTIDKSILITILYISHIYNFRNSKHAIDLFTGHTL